MAINYKLIGKRVKEFRKERGFSQAELAALSKTSAQYLSEVENGKKKVSLQILVSVSEILEITVDELLAGNQVKNTGEYSKEIMQMLEGCSSYEKRVIFEMLINLKQILRDNQELLIQEIDRI